VHIATDIFRFAPSLENEYPVPGFIVRPGRQSEKGRIESGLSLFTMPCPVLAAAVLCQLVNSNLPGAILVIPDGGTPAGVNPAVGPVN
jgi:hypothetical protein